MTRSVPSSRILPVHAVAYQPEVLLSGPRTAPLSVALINVTTSLEADALSWSHSNVLVKEKRGFYFLLASVN